MGLNIAQKQPAAVWHAEEHKCELTVVSYLNNSQSPRPPISIGGRHIREVHVLPICQPQRGTPLNSILLPESQRVRTVLLDTVDRLDCEGQTWRQVSTRMDPNRPRSGDMRPILQYDRVSHLDPSTKLRGQAYGVAGLTAHMTGPSLAEERRFPCCSRPGTIVKALHMIAGMQPHSVGEP